MAQINMFAELIKKHIKLQLNVLKDYIVFPKNFEERALEIADKVGWQPGEPQVISQGILIFLADKLKVEGLNYKILLYHFRLSIQSYKKWTKIVSDVINNV